MLQTNNKETVILCTNEEHNLIKSDSFAFNKVLLSQCIFLLLFYQLDLEIYTIHLSLGIIL